MRIVLVNQAFYPDVVSSGQHLTDLAFFLAEQGHEVTVVTSQRAYDNPARRFPREETVKGVRILRVFATGFGKRAKWRRAVDFASFLCSCSLRLLCLPRQDLVVAMTSPPLVSFVGAWVARLRGSQFAYWIMDLNPDEALAAGWLNPNSLAARWLEYCSRFGLRRAAKIVVLDHFMQQRILAKGMSPEKVVVIPPWSHDAEVAFNAGGRNHFRKEHGLENRFVVMYSGNHSPCHPLDTVLQAAKQLNGRHPVTFCFIGGGSEFKRTEQFAREHGLANILCLPYQPIEQLAATLSAADLHLVVMGNPFVGLVHPCKVYNILRIGSPILYIGPEPSHISEIINELGSQRAGGRADHGDIDRAVQVILSTQKAAPSHDREASRLLANRYSEEKLLPMFVKMLETMFTIRKESH